VNESASYDTWRKLIARGPKILEAEDVSDLPGAAAFLGSAGHRFALDNLFYRVEWTTKERARFHFPAASTLLEARSELDHAVRAHLESVEWTPLGHTLAEAARIAGALATVLRTDPLGSDVLAVELAQVEVQRDAARTGPLEEPGRIGPESRLETGAAVRCVPVSHAVLEPIMKAPADPKSLREAPRWLGSAVVSFVGIHRGPVCLDLGPDETRAMELAPGRTVDDWLDRVEDDELLSFEAAQSLLRRLVASRALRAH
jgi:hypothetical protein